eukprot:6212439-Pleurochrysis_carterae.AAC.3
MHASSLPIIDNSEAFASLHAFAHGLDDPSVPAPTRAPGKRAASSAPPGARRRPPTTSTPAASTPTAGTATAITSPDATATRPPLSARAAAASSSGDPAPRAPAATLASSHLASPFATQLFVGSTLVVPAAVYPQYVCEENAGLGWTVSLRALRGPPSAPATTTLVAFVYARTADGRKYANEWLLVSHLRRVSA